MKKIIASVLLCAIMGLCPMTALAETNVISENNEMLTMVSPRLTYIIEAQTALDIDNNIATVDCWVKGNVLSATKAKVIVELQLKSGNNWIAYGTWTETANAFKASVYETKSVKTGQTYRVKATYTVWEGSQSETVTSYTDEMTA